MFEDWHQAGAGAGGSKPLFVLSYDQGKAYDSVQRYTVRATLERFNMPESFIKWILGMVFLMLYSKMEACAVASMAEGSKTEHSARVKSNKFYSEFLNPRFADFIEKKRAAPAK